MKKTLIAAAVLMVAFTSCKKQYHCSCEVTSSQGQTYQSVTHSFEETEKGAEKACQSQEQDSKLSGQSATCIVVPD